MIFKNLFFNKAPQHVHEWGKWKKQLTSIHVVQVRECLTCGFSECQKLRDCSFAEYLANKIFEDFE